MESKVEKYIQDYTKYCSNLIDNPIHAIAEWNFFPWLTPDQARAVAQIAKEEVIEKALDWVKSHCTDRGYKDFKECMEG